MGDVDLVSVPLLCLGNSETNVSMESGVSSMEDLLSTNTSFQSQSLNDHLSNCYQHGYYQAVSRIIARSAYQTPNPPSESIYGPWLMVFLHIAKLVSMTRGQAHEIISSILSFVFNALKCVMQKAYPRLPLPLTLGEFQSMVMNESNSNSLKSVLPIPYFFRNEETEHTILSPMELVPMTMFMPPQSSLLEGICDRYRSTVKSESFFERRNQIPRQYLEHAQSVPTILVYITLWSDGWDPNQSGKANRSPVWTSTGTMIFVELGVEDSPYLANIQFCWGWVQGRQHTTNFLTCWLLRNKRNGRMLMDFWNHSLFIRVTTIGQSTCSSQWLWRYKTIQREGGVPIF